MRGWYAPARINSENIHDVFPPDNEIARIRFIDKYIHYNYQRLLEGAYHTFIYPIALQVLKSKNKGTDKMDVFNCNQILEKTDFKHLTEYYDHTVRNAIAHNDIEFKEKEILYRNRNNEKTIHTLQIIKLFDNLLDVCNGIAFAFKTFFLAKIRFVNDYKLRVPKWIIIEELITNLNTNEWEIEDLFESVLSDGRKQLVIYGKNSLLSYQEALYYSFQTALLSERFIGGYDRYYLSSESKYGWLCFGGFKGDILKVNRLNGTQNYQEVVDDVLFFHPNFKTPKFFRKMRRMYFVLKTEYKYIFQKIRRKSFEVRWTKIHVVLHAKSQRTNRHICFLL